tara:strand:+ start:2555 stop:2815 length:261 start_codon:yes stop_codon:yes gene_type:complete
MENNSDETETNTTDTTMTNFCEDNIRNDINSIRASLEKKSLQQKTIDQIQNALKQYESIQQQMNNYMQISRENTERIDDIERQCKE